MSTAHDQFMQKYQALSLKQQRWLRGKARWERMSLMAVLNDWTPPEDSKLTPCGSAVCYGCELCKPPLAAMKSKRKEDN